MVPAREQLTVYVPEEGELPGLTFYGLAPLGGPAALPFPDGVWPYTPDASPLRLHGEGWQVRGCDFPLLVWPSSDAFREAVRATLTAPITDGACVGWVGAPSLFCDPPGLLDPDCMSGGVLAWLTEDGWFGCPIDPDQPWVTASDQDMHELRRRAAHLAAIGG